MSCCSRRRKELLARSVRSTVSKPSNVAKASPKRVSARVVGICDIDNDTQLEGTKTSLIVFISDKKVRHEFFSAYTSSKCSVLPEFDLMKARWLSLRLLKRKALLKKLGKRFKLQDLTEALT